MNLYEQQAANRRRTWLVMAIFCAFLLAIGYGFDRVVLGYGFAPFPIGAALAVGVGSISAAASYFAGDRAVLRSTAAMPLDTLLEETRSDEALLRLKQLDNVVDEMTIAAGLPRPRVYVVPDEDPNAFATGRDPAHASVAVTQGLLHSLDRDELQGVIAHELGHVRNLDIRLMTVVAALVGAMALLSDWTGRSLRFAGGRWNDRDDDGRGRGAGGAVLLIVWLAVVIVAPIIAQALAMMVSRSREYLADATAAELTRNPLALAAALDKIERAAGPTRSIHRGSAHLCIADPLVRTINLREGFWADLFASHPPMASRIAALRRMAYADAPRGADPESRRGR